MSMRRVFSQEPDKSTAMRVARETGEAHRGKAVVDEYPPNLIAMEYGIFKLAWSDYLDVCKAYDEARGLR